MLQGMWKIEKGFCGKGVWHTKMRLLKLRGIATDATREKGLLRDISLAHNVCEIASAGTSSNPNSFPSFPPFSPGECECSDRGSYHILYGAIVGGPREDDSHHDKCPDFIT